jgi:hypothetical protein
MTSPELQVARALCKNLLALFISGIDERLLAVEAQGSALRPFM